MKVFYPKSLPKSRQRACSLTGVCFDMSWQMIAEAVDDYRRKHGYKDRKCNIDSDGVESVRVTDEGIQFVEKMV